MSTKILIQILDERDTRWLMGFETLRDQIDMDVRKRVMEATANRVPYILVSIEERPERPVIVAKESRHDDAPVA
jgi:hypothetical protein